VGHAIYLINPASREPGLREKSAVALLESAGWAARMGLSTLILHAGHAIREPVSAALERAGSVLTRVLRDIPEGLTLSLETTSGGSGSIGGSFEHFAALLNETGGDARIRVWLDTAHLFEAGYDLRSSPGLGKLLADIDGNVGRDRISGAHANDSKTSLGSRVDRHENVGSGLIGEEGFRFILRHPFFRRLPFVLETPGFDPSTGSGSNPERGRKATESKGFDNRGPDRKNMEIMRRLAAGVQ
jgi:deoxyribonuclease-4